MTQSNSSKKKKLSTSELNRSDLKVNRGVELILNKPKKGGVTVSTELITIVTLPIAFLLFSVGVVTGWLIRDYMMNYQEIPRPHPEMFDENGNLTADEILAVRFEQHDNTEDDEED